MKAAPKEANYSVFDFKISVFSLSKCRYWFPQLFITGGVMTVLAVCRARLLHNSHGKHTVTMYVMFFFYFYFQ